MKKHIHYFDHLRLIAALSVIYMHVASTPLRGVVGTNWKLINIFTCFGFTAVPLFFMMSGYLMLSSTKTEDLGTLFKKRLPKLVIPLVGWTVVALLWKYYQDRSLINFADRLIESLRSPAAVHFWYIYTLVALYILSPILCAALRSLDKKGHALVLAIAVIPSVFYMIQVLLPTSLDKLVNFDIVSKLTFFNGHLNTFVLGYYVCNIKKKIPNWILVVSGLTVLSVIVCGTYYLTIKNGTYTDTFQSQAKGFEVLLAAILMVFFKQNFNNESKFFKLVPIVPLSMSIYFMHNILLSMMVYFAPGMFAVKSFWDTIEVTLLNFLICFFTMKTVATIKPICYLATGMSYKTACESCNWVYTYNRVKGWFTKNTSVT